MKVIVVDSNNHWLVSGEFESKEKAIEEAKEATDYDPEAELIVYEVLEEL